MKNVLIVGCDAFMNDAYACPGDWKCLKSAALGEGEFTEPVTVLGLVRCKCPGRTLAPNVGFTIKNLEMKPDAIYLSTCFASARPECPFTLPEEAADLITSKTGLPVIHGTHNWM